MDQNTKREMIKKIKNDKTLTEKEKSIKIQQIFSSNFINNIQSKSNNLHTCSHYDKQCSKFKFSCCDITDPCKRCHIDRDCCNTKDIHIKNITCNLCGLEQEPSNTCSNPECIVKFSTSYCEICQIWTSKNIHHCKDCGICRVGTKQTLFHCVDCGTCFNVGEDANQTHQCANINITTNASTHNIKNNNKWIDALCVVCGESTFNSQSESINLPCSHFIHNNCFTQYIQQSNYKCPYCKKSICDLSAQWDFIRSQIKRYPIPNDMIPIEPGDIVDTPYGKFSVCKIYILNQIKLFEGEFISWFSDKKLQSNVKATLNYLTIKKNLYKKIYCNDCGKNSTTLYHFYGLECVECGSFNTQE